MNGTTLATMRKLKNDNGIYLWRPGYKAGQPETMLGRAVLEGLDMPNVVAAATPIIFGDFKRAIAIMTAWRWT